MSQDRPPNFLWSVTNSLGSIGQRYRRKRKLDAPMPLPPMTLSPSWSLPVTAQGSTYEAARLLAASVASNPPREFLAEKDMAITLVQKRIRRNQCLARLWDVEGGGLFVQWQCVKIQRRWRGTRGRAEGHVRFHRHVFLAAARINALYMGMRARRLARELRVAIAEKAALKLQTVYRGRLGAKFFMKWREMRRTESVKFLQRCYAPAVLKLLDNWHAAHPKDPIRKWQHKRVLQLLLDNVALVSPITAPTAELANLDVRRALVVDPDRGAKIAGPGLQEKALDRLLKDTKKCLRDHRARVAADRKKQAARGLPPTEPSRQQREIAKGRFKARLGANPISAKVMAAKRKEERKAARAREEAKQAKEERERKAAAGPAAGDDDAAVTNYLDGEPEPDSD